MKNLDPLTWCMGCVFEQKGINGIVKAVQTAVIQKIIERVHVISDRLIPANTSIKFRPKREESGGNWPTDRQWDA